MANAKDNFIKGARKVPFTVGGNTLQAFPLRQALNDSFGKLGIDLPMDLSKVNNPNQH